MSKNRRVNLPSTPIAKPTSSTQVTQQVSWSGPLPPPDLLARYEELSNGFASRIIAMAEKNAENQREAILKSVDQRALLLRRGQWFGFFGLLACLAASVACAWLGADGPASAIGGIAVAGVVASFVVGRSKPEQGSGSNH